MKQDGQPSVEVKLDLSFDNSLICFQCCGAALILRLRLQLRVIFKSQLIKNSKSWFFYQKWNKMNDSFAWTEQKLKRNLNSLSYFEKICWLWKCFFGIITGAGAGAGSGAKNVFFFGSGSSKKLRLRAAPAPQHCLQPMYIHASKPRT